MKNVRFSRNGVEFEPTKQELKIVLDDFAKQIGEKDKRIAEVEKQLADVKNSCDYYMKRSNNLVLKLAEKDKLINEYADEHAMLQCKIADLAVKEIKAENFAIEQLGKVKEFFLEEHRDEEMDTDYIITKDAGQIADYLLDQIKQLKGLENE